MTPDELKQWRASLGLSQRAAAAAHCVTLPTYQSWERGGNWHNGKHVAIKPATAAMCEKISRDAANIT